MFPLQILTLTQSVSADVKLPHVGSMKYPWINVYGLRQFKASGHMQDDICIKFSWQLTMMKLTAATASLA